MLAAQASGASDVRLMLRHVLPNIASVVLIAFLIGVGAFILFEATISFLGDALRDGPDPRLRGT